ncbi:S1 family peptidase [Vibrio chagasii]|uniref:S1 family peptidase n=1 Tax=Vibrio chagasii TaxID=170679 RepID=UPI002284D30B|nr:S1 family peptidase [Vibrio chagasii]MCY9828823.1 S1 family peptidase [Vibrio chagasii]
MNKTLLTLMALAISPSSFAVVNGTPLDWSQYNNTVMIEAGNNPEQHYCTATMIGGRFAVTAAHCVDGTEPMSTLKTYYGNSILGNITLHPQWGVNRNCLNGFNKCNDIAFLNVDTAVLYNKINYFIDSNPYTATDPLDSTPMDSMTIAGFGGTPTELNQADYTTSAYNLYYAEEMLEADMVNNSHTTGGDSGAAWINSHKEIIALHQGSDPENGRGHTTYGTNIDYVRPFILEVVNGWHYPTVVKTAEGKATITLQSLHQTPPTLAVRQADIMSDYLDVVNSTCLTKVTMQPFEKCTVVINGLTDGELSTVYLGLSDRDSFSQEIQLNASMPTKPSDTPTDNSGSSSGGSIGFLSLFGLGLLGRLRKKEN